MISEASCETEDWSNDAENSALKHRNKLHFKIYLNTKKQLFHIYYFINLLFHSFLLY